MARPSGVRSLVVTLLLLGTILVVCHVRWPLDDFSEYWTAGKLNAGGANPYDPAAMQREQSALGWTQPAPVMMYNPPWTLAFAMPMSAVDFHVARSIWLPLQLLLILWSAERLWTLYAVPTRATRAWFIALLWAPTIIALRLGQLSPLVLVGLVGFLWCLIRKREVSAGAFMCLTAVKPQLVAIVWIAVALWILSERKRNVLAGIVACLTGSTIVAVFTNPHVFAQYAALMQSAPPTLTFESPNLATVLRVAIGTNRSWPQYVPTAIGIGWLFVQWKKWPRANDDWLDRLPGLVLMSCLLTSYGGWALDLVILLVPIVAMIPRAHSAGRAPLFATVFVAVSGTIFAMHQAGVPQPAFLWITPAVAAAWLVRSGQTDDGFRAQPIGAVV